MSPCCAAYHNVTGTYVTAFIGSCMLLGVSGLSAINRGFEVTNSSDFSAVDLLSKTVRSFVTSCVSGVLSCFARFGVVLALLTGLLGLSACSGQNNFGTNLGLFNQGGDAASASASQKARVAFAPLVGVPGPIAPKLMAAVKNSAAQKNWQLVGDAKQAQYAIHGHFTSYTTRQGAKLSYIWDVKDQRGVHLHRVIGNQPIQGKKVANGWSLVNDQVISQVALASTDKLNSWLLKRAGASKQSPLRRDTDGPRNISPVASRHQGLSDDPVITGAVGKRTAVSLTNVLPVQGAPGDGRISLTNALRNELKKNGVALTKNKVANGYTVKGMVKLQRAVRDKQKIEIVWNVLDGNGNRVGTVSQKNEVPKGSLNGAWGPTAEAAASAAAKGIVKLLPRKK